MTGLEQNSDIVPMASCVLLLAQVEGLPLQPQPEPSLREVGVRSPGATVTVHTGDAMTYASASQAVTTGADRERVRLAIPERATELSLRAVWSADDEGFVVAFGDPRTSTGHELLVGGWQNRSTCLNRVDDGIANDLDGPLPYRGCGRGSRSRIRCWVD